MAAVWFSATPSSIILTLVARNRPAGARSRCSINSASWSIPRCRSHHSAPTTLARSVPLSAARRYAGTGSPDLCDLPTMASCQRGQQPRDEVRGAFLEHADRFAAGVTLDPAVGRIEAVAGDAGQLHRLGVDPRAVAIAVGQEHRAVRGDL